MSSPAPPPTNATDLRIRIPVPLLEAVDAIARTDGMNRSEAIRHMLAERMTQRGVWPPKTSAAR